MKKALWIAYDIVLDDEIVALLASCGITAYTRWPRLTGNGPNSGARLDDSVWPGANAAIMTVADETSIAKAMDALQRLRDEVGTLTGVWACTTQVLETLK